MNVFKLAVTIIARHWSYLLIYTLVLGCMAILGSGAIEAPQASEFSNDAPKVAVVDRDGSELSAALTDFALKDAVEVHVEDSPFALQDAAAKDLASYVLIIPEGFQEGLVEAAHSGADARNRGELPGRAWRAHGPARESIRAVALWFRFG